jgi:hypothetical protein
MELARGGEYGRGGSRLDAKKTQHQDDGQTDSGERSQQVTAQHRCSSIVTSVQVCSSLVESPPEVP